MYDIRTLQLRILGNLLAVDTVCREHSLQYYIYDGTMLGAVRHKGFIPWDDDLDIAMPREDYETFITHANEWLPEPYEFVSYELDSAYPLPFGKVQDASTTLIERPHLPYLGGLYIDVFPIDGVPSNAFLRRCHLVRYDVLKKLVYMAYRDPYRHGHGPSSWLPLLCRKVIGQQRLQRATRRLLRKYPFAKSDKVCVFDDGFHGVIDKAILGQPTPVGFEGHEVMGVEHPHEYLSHMYGDYMVIPPHDDQKQHRFHYVDFTHSYHSHKAEEHPSPSQVDVDFTHSYHSHKAEEHPSPSQVE
ncbi:MAG: LicD family protein [Prevotella sp.]|nr:LicD family protein [Prevotella sp.]